MRYRARLSASTGNRLNRRTRFPKESKRDDRRGPRGVISTMAPADSSAIRRPTGEGRAMKTTLQAAVLAVVGMVLAA